MALFLLGETLNNRALPKEPVIFGNCHGSRLVKSARIMRLLYRAGCYRTVVMLFKCDRGRPVATHQHVVMSDMASTCLPLTSSASEYDYN